MNGVYAGHHPIERQKNWICCIARGKCGPAWLNGSGCSSVIDRSVTYSLPHIRRPWPRTASPAPRSGRSGRLCRPPDETVAAFAKKLPIKQLIWKRVGADCIASTGIRRRGASTCARRFCTCDVGCTCDVRARRFFAGMWICPAANSSAYMAGAGKRGRMRGCRQWMHGWSSPKAAPPGMQPGRGARIPPHSSFLWALLHGATKRGMYRGRSRMPRRQPVSQWRICSHRLKEGDRGINAGGRFC
jgi:hypothetical protein